MSEEPSRDAELAKLISRFTDRIFPEPDDGPRREASRWTRYGVTALGASMWTALLAVVIIAYTAGAVWVQVEWFLLLLLLLLAIGGLFVVLIGKSVRRGTPLSFFLWGLSVPTLALSILKFAFLFGLGEALN